MTMNTTSYSTETAAACCSDFYEQDWVRRIAGECFHPGGEDLTRRTIDAMRLVPGARVADLGCGTGTSALLLAHDYSFWVSAIDLSRANIDHAAQRAADADAHPERAQFIHANAGHLPFADGELDGVLSECAFSLFADKPAVLREMTRVLKPGGRIGVTDMAVGGALPDDIAEMLAPWTCLTDALTHDGYARLFTEAGLAIEHFQDESTALHALLATIKRNLLVLATGKALGDFQGAGFDLGTVKHWMDRFQTEIDADKIRYLRFNLVYPA